MDRQRKVIYAERRAVLAGEDLQEQIRTFLDDTVAGYVMGATEGYAEEWDLEALWTALRQIYPVSIDHAALVDEVGGVGHLDREELLERLKADAHAAYDEREQQVGEEVMRELERRVVLSVLDRKWREHLYEMDYLREGIYLRAYSQRDPLVEYQREGFDMFNAMMDGIKEESVGFLFNLEVQVEEDEDDEDDVEGVEEAEVEEPMRRQLRSEEQPSIRAKGLETPSRPQQLAYSAPDESGEAAAVRTETTPAEDPFAKVGRNDKCPCGSGKKYKQCHGRPGGPTGLTARVS